uniref:Globin family profile domain-containing protein n=1 Tax=Parascaris univalens TaxID=6257 RepID=A0A915CH43_PARUN
MGSALCSPKKRKKAIGSWVGSDSENPFEQTFTKKERVCLRETFQKLADPKELIGMIFVDIVNDTVPELKKVFGVERAPKAAMLKMPKFGGHVVRFTDLIDQLTNMLGYTENLLGAWQLVRKTGRAHIKQQFLEMNQSAKGTNYFAIVANTFIAEFIPYLTGEKEEPNVDDKKKVRFASTYAPLLIADVWRRFFNVIVEQMTDAFEQESHKQSNALNQKALAPHQHVEDDERMSEIDNTATNVEGPKCEEMFEDPF